MPFSFPPQTPWLTYTLGVSLCAATMEFSRHELCIQEPKKAQGVGSHGMVAVIPGPETLPSWTLQSPSPHVPSPMDLRELTFLLGGRIAQLGEWLAGTHKSNSSLMALS